MVVSNSSVPDFPAIMLGMETTGVKLNSHKHKLKHRFEIVRKLGQGTYGKVQLAVNRETGQEVAIKTIKKAKIETDQDLVRIRREIQIMSSVQHPSIIHIYEVFENKEKMILVMEYAAGGELYDYLSDRKVLVEEEARRIFRQISAAVYYCHKHKICHRDLKLENILLDDKGNAKIADFGLSNVFDNKHCLNTFCGSPLYASPEIVKGIPYYGPEVDCWSLGVLLYTLVYGAMPFDGSNFKRLVKQITGGEYFEPKKKSDASELIRCILTVSPKRRADIEDICSHWWVNEGYSISCLEVADELACQTPVRLDLLLSLAPAPKSSEKLVIDQPAGAAGGGKEGEVKDGAVAGAAAAAKVADGTDELEAQGAVGGPPEVMKREKPEKNGKQPPSPEVLKGAELFAKDNSGGSVKAAEPLTPPAPLEAESAPPPKKPMIRHLSLTSKQAKEKVAKLEESGLMLPLPTPPPTPPITTEVVPVVEQTPLLAVEATPVKMESEVTEVQPKEKKAKKVKKVEKEPEKEPTAAQVVEEAKLEEKKVIPTPVPDPKTPEVTVKVEVAVEKAAAEEEQPASAKLPENEDTAKPVLADSSETSSVASSATSSAPPKKKVIKKVIKSKVPKATTKEPEKPQEEPEKKAVPEKRTSPPSPAISVKKSATAKAATTEEKEKPTVTVVRRNSKTISDTAKAFDANGPSPSKIPSSVGSKTLERPKKVFLPGLSNIRDAKKAFESKDSSVEKPKPLVLPSRTVSDAKKRFEVTGGAASAGKPPVAPTMGATKSKTEGRISSLPFAEKVAKIVAKTKEKTPPKIEKKEEKVKQKSPPLVKAKEKVKAEEQEKKEIPVALERRASETPASGLPEEKPAVPAAKVEEVKGTRDQKKAALKGTLKAAASAKSTKSVAPETPKLPEGCKTVVMELSPNVKVEATMRIDSGEPSVVAATVSKPTVQSTQPKSLPATPVSHGLHHPPPLPAPSAPPSSSVTIKAKSVDIPGSETSFLRKAATPGPVESQRRSFVATVSTSSSSSLPQLSSASLTPPTPTREESVTPTPSEQPKAPSPVSTGRVFSPTSTPTAEVPPSGPIHVRSISAPVRQIFSPPPAASVPLRAPSVGKERLVPIFLADSDVPVSGFQQQQQQQVPQKPPQLQQQKEGSIGRSFFTSPLERRDSSRSERDWSETSSISGRQTPAAAAAAGGLQHSRREYIIPIALEDGGFASTPSTATATPSTASTMSSSPFFHERSVTPGAVGGEASGTPVGDMFGSFGRSSLAGRTSSGRRMWSLFNDEDAPSLSNTRLQRLSSFGKSMPTSNAAYRSATRSAGSSGNPKPRFKSSIDRSDSFSSAGEEDDDEEGFEILTAESLFSTLLERVRNLSRRMNKDDSLFNRMNSPLVSQANEGSSTTASRQESPSPWSSDWPSHSRYGSSQRAPKTPVRTSSLKSTYATSGKAMPTSSYAGSSSGRTTPTGAMSSSTLPRSSRASPAGSYFRSSFKNYDDPEGYDLPRRKESDVESCYSDSAALPSSSYQARNYPPRQSESPPPSSSSSVGPESTANFARRVANYFSRAPSSELHSITENEAAARNRRLAEASGAAGVGKKAAAYGAEGATDAGSAGGVKQYGRSGRAKTDGSLLPGGDGEEGAAAGGPQQSNYQRTTSSFRPGSRYSMYLSGSADDSTTYPSGMSTSSTAGTNNSMSKSTYGSDFGNAMSKSTYGGDLGYSRPESALGDFSSSSVGASAYQTLPRSGFQRPMSMVDHHGVPSSQELKSQYSKPSVDERKSQRDVKRYAGNLSDSWQSTTDLTPSSAASGFTSKPNTTENRDAARRISTYLNDALKRRGAYSSSMNLATPSSATGPGARSVVSDGPPMTSFGTSGMMTSYNPELSDYNTTNYSSATLGRPSRRITVAGVPPPVAGSKRWSTMMNYGAGGFNPQEPFVGSSLPKLEESLLSSASGKVNGGPKTAEPGEIVPDPVGSSARNPIPQPPTHQELGNGNQDQSETCSVSASSDVSDLDNSISSCIDGELSVSERILRKSYYSRFNDSLSRRRSASSHQKMNPTLSSASSISKLMGSSFENLAASSSSTGTSGKKKAKSKTESSVHQRVGEATGLPRSGGEKPRVSHSSKDRSGDPSGRPSSSSGARKKLSSAGLPVGETASRHERERKSRREAEAAGSIIP